MTHDHDHALDHDQVAGDDLDWDTMYRESEQRWSGHVNGSLVAELDGHPARRALDVGCGEGADAIWLAEQGWKVTAVDISPTAIERGAAEAAARGLDLDWRAGDILTERPTAESYDLVALHYPGFPIERLDDVVSALTDAVAPGGTLLVVGHAPLADPSDSPFARDEWVQAEDVAARLGEGWTVETHEIRPRPGDHHRHHGSPHVDDVVVRARRTG